MPDTAHHSPTIYVASISWAERNVAKIDPPYLLSLIDPEMENPVWPGRSNLVHMTICLDDITTEGIAVAPYYSPPSEEHARSIIEFGRQWNGETDLLVHCMAGRSRSAAAALALLCMHRRNAMTVVSKSLRKSGPWLEPNPVMVKHLDAAGDFSGRLQDALSAMGPARMKGTREVAAIELGKNRRSRKSA